MANLIVENLHTVLEYSEKVATSGALGHLQGIGAEFNAPTRNGRRYPIELWRNVMASEDFKEMMETHTCFAETDHPETRVDTSIKEVCAVLTNMEIRENEGILWVEFDILDTPQGRILKSLVDYGCKIGVSSRGLGDEIQRNGETIIDPDTYSYYGHDMVVQPAVKAARPDKVESLARAKVTDVFKKEIENATTKTELVGLKRLAESVNMPDLDSITESIDNKLSNGSLDGNNISEQLENDLGKLAEENEELRSQIESLKKANNIGIKKNRKLSETYKSEAITARRTLRKLEVENERLERNNRSIQSELRENNSRIREVEMKQSQEIEVLKGQLKEALEEVHLLQDKLRSKSRELSEKERKLESLTESVRDSKSRIVELENEISNKSDELDSLYEENSELNSDLEKVHSDRMISESKMTDVSNKLTEQGNHLNEVLEKYVDTKCQSLGIDKNRLKSELPSNYTIENVEAVASKLFDEKRRLDKVPISFNGPISAKIENSNADPEMAQIMRLMEGVRNHT